MATKQATTHNSKDHPVTSGCNPGNHLHSFTFEHLTPKTASSAFSPRNPGSLNLQKPMLQRRRAERWPAAQAGK